MNQDALEKLVLSQGKRIALLEEALELADDLLGGLVQAVVILGKRTKPTVGCDASDHALYGPGCRLRALPSAITHEGLGEAYAAQAEALAKAETEEAKHKRLRRQNAILELRKIRAAREEKLERAAEEKRAALAKLNNNGGGISL